MVTGGIQHLGKLLASGEMSASSICRQCRSTIAELDRQGPNLGAIISTLGDSDVSYRISVLPSSAKSSQRLAGIPIAVKDNIDTMDGLGCTGGSSALSNVRVDQNAFLIQRLEDAGAIIFAKTNLSEWANFRSTRSVSGWSSAGGQTRNPYILDRSPCGSSSGSAVAVAAGMVPAAVGTETDGSIICPSAINGIVGLKPTLGRISRSGVIPIAASQDTAGPMTRSVFDAALMLAAMEGEDSRDPETMNPLRDGQPGVFSDFGMKSLGGLRLGYYDGSDSFLAEVKTLFHSCLGIMELDKADIRNIGSLPDMSELQAAEFILLLCEFRDDIAGYLQNRSQSPFSSISDLIVYNIDNKHEVMPLFGQELFYKASETKGRKDPRYKPAKQKCEKLARTDGLELIFDEYRLDVLLMPSNNPSWLLDPILGDHITGGSSTLAAVSGWPSITIPMGTIFGLPVGMSLITRPWQEHRLLAVAHRVEQLLHRVGICTPRPRFLPHLDL